MTQHLARDEPAARDEGDQTVRYEDDQTAVRDEHEVVRDEQTVRDEEPAAPDQPVDRDEPAWDHEDRDPHDRDSHDRDSHDRDYQDPVADRSYQDSGPEDGGYPVPAPSTVYQHGEPVEPAGEPDAAYPDSVPPVTTPFAGPEAPVDDEVAAGETPVGVAAVDDHLAETPPADQPLPEVPVPAEPMGEAGFEVWSAEEVTALRERWREVQLQFVDDPRTAADAAGALIGEAVDRLVDGLRAYRNDLDAWRGPDGTDSAGDSGSDTERLRTAVRRYRQLLDRLAQL